MLKIFGTRMVVTPVDEAYDGLVVLPPGMGRHNHILAEVLEVGVETPDFASELVKGDTVLIQANDYMLQASTFKHHDKNCLVLLESEAVAKLTSRTVALESFQVLGHWALVAGFVNRPSDSRVVIPDTVQETSEQMRFKLIQLGSRAVNRPQVGNEVVVDKGRLNPLRLGGADYFYLPAGSLLVEVVE